MKYSRGYSACVSGVGVALGRNADGVGAGIGVGVIVTVGVGVGIGVGVEVGVAVGTGFIEAPSMTSSMGEDIVSHEVAKYGLLTGRKLSSSEDIATADPKSAVTEAVLPLM